jgi:transposase
MKNDTQTLTIPRSEYNSMRSEYELMKQENESLKAQNAELSQKVEWLMGQFRLSQQRRFGSSSEKSEYDGFEQPNLFNEVEALADIPAPASEPEPEEIVTRYRKRKRLVNDRLPEDLPVEVIEHSLPAEDQICPECSHGLHVMGRDTRRELVVIPAQAKIREHVTNVYACRNCEKNDTSVPIITASKANPVIKGSFASPEIIAHIMHQKFVMGTPLYRQEQDWNRQGIELSRQTMSNWLIRAAEDYLEPIYNALKDKLLLRNPLYADETTLQVLREPDKSAQSKSYMWLYRSREYDNQGIKDNHPIVLYDYQPDRRKERPAEFLKGYKGYLHTDGYEVYHSLPEDIIVVGCLAHARRKFDEAMKQAAPKDRHNSNAAKGKLFCDKLFELERDFINLSPDERYKKRLELSKPVMAEFFAWLEVIKPMPKTAIGVAVNYALGQRVYLERFLLDGRLELSNNRAERSIKPFVIGRKNFLFANTPRGAKASSIIYSIVETAKESGLNPFSYLAHIFSTAPNFDIRSNMDALDSLLPCSAPDDCRGTRF